MSQFLKLLRQRHRVVWHDLDLHLVHAYQRRFEQTTPSPLRPLNLGQPSSGILRSYVTVSSSSTDIFDASIRTSPNAQSTPDLKDKSATVSRSSNSEESILIRTLRTTGQGWEIRGNATLIKQEGYAKLLAEHIRWRHLDKQQAIEGQDGNGSDKVLLALYNNSTDAYLNRVGCKVEDIESWAWILTSPSASKAVHRLQKLRDLAPDAGWKVPWIVIHLVLRAQRLEPVALQQLLSYTWDRFKAESDPNSSRNGIMVNARMSLALLELFIYQSRRILPEAMDSIAELACFAFGGHLSVGEMLKLSGLARSRLTLSFNKVIALLGVPCARNPYQSIAIQQKAQFRILERMTEFTPHIPINRDGLHGMLRTQIAHTKTMSEREWADYKMITWPPWKKDRTGLDVERVFEGSISRGRQVLQRLVESGYEPKSWEKMASILSGWDVDGSPTIQTRRILPPIESRPSSNLAWSRILSTRTLKEAWACFLEYEKSMRESTNKSKPSIAPYEAMLERLLAPKAVPNSITFAGDGRERYPEPTSPHDFFYVSEDPPNPHEFLERMKDAGLDPSDRVIQLLIDHASNLHSVIDLLNAFPQLTPHLHLLLRLEQYHPRVFLHRASKVPMAMLLAYVRFLVRVNLPGKEFRIWRYQIPVSMIPRIGITTLTRRDEDLAEKCGLTSYEINNLSSSDYARYILKLGEVRHQAAWYSVLNSSIQKLRRLDNKPHSLIFNDDAWTRLKQVLSDMDELGVFPDNAVVEMICDGLCDVLPASRSSEGLSSDQIHAQCIDLIKPLFSRLVTGFSDFSDLSLNKANLMIPSPYSLLSFVRVLGLTGEYRSMVDLLQWMATRPQILDMKARQTVNGRSKLRNVIVTIRVFLERLWADVDFLNGSSPSKVAKHGRTDLGQLLDQAREVVEAVPEWNGWPTDEEARQSCWTAPGSYDWKQRLQLHERNGEVISYEPDGNI